MSKDSKKVIAINYGWEYTSLLVGKVENNKLFVLEQNCCQKLPCEKIAEMTKSFSKVYSNIYEPLKVLIPSCKQFSESQIENLLDYFESLKAENRIAVAQKINFSNQYQKDCLKILLKGCLEPLCGKKSSFFFMSLKKPIVNNYFL